MRIIRRILSKFSQSAIVMLTNMFPEKGQILMLHWIEDAPINNDKEPYRISVFQFKTLLSYLKQKRTIKLSDWEKENNFYAITIDDVPESFYYNAYPLLREFGIPFTIFINTTLLGKEGYITEEQLILMSQCDLCTIGSHGVNHCEFAFLTPQKIKEEFYDSKKYLESIIGREVTLFAFPYGTYYACGYRNKNLALDVYKYAFGTIPCPISKPLFLKKYFLPRINVNTLYIQSLK